MTACEVAADPTSKDLCHTDPVKYVSDSSAEYHLPTYQKKKKTPYRCQNKGYTSPVHKRASERHLKFISHGFNWWISIAIHWRRYENAFAQTHIYDPNEWFQKQQQHYGYHCQMLSWSVFIQCPSWWRFDPDAGDKALLPSKRHRQLLLKYAENQKRAKN